MVQTVAIEMVQTVSEGFAALDKALLLDEQQDKQAKEVRAKIDQILTDAGWQELSLLQGSYGRKTMLPPLKDVDVAVILPDSRRYLLDDPSGSGQAMDGFREAIVDSGESPGVRFDPEGPKAHALRLAFPEVTFTVDLVPAFETDDYDWLVIADREKNRWDKRSDVRGLRDKVVARNVLCRFKWVRQVRHGKHALRQVPPIKELVCGLIIESLAYEVVTKAMPPQQAAEAIFARGAEVLGHPYRGLAQTDLTVKWTPFDRQSVLAYFRQMRDLARQAISCEAAGDHAAAAGLWRQIYGQHEFPGVRVSLEESLIRVARGGGGVTSAGHLTRSVAVPGAANPARPWRVR